MINKTVGAIPPVYSGMSYRELELCRAELDMDEDGDLVVIFPDDDEKAKLTEYGFASLCEALKVPIRFGKRLREDGKNHILAYLQKQLSQAYAIEPVIAVLKEKYLLSFTTPNLLPFQGTEVSELDQAIIDHCMATGSITLESRMVSNDDIVYDFVLDQKVIDADPNHSEWKCGHSFHYSLIGKELPYFTVFAIRVADGSRMVFPERRFRHKLSRNKKYDSMKESVFDYLKALPEPEWDALSGYMKKLTAVSASMRELKDVRSRLVRALKVDKDDKATVERIEKLLYWNEIVEEYGLKDLDVKPSKNWFIKASTPHTLWFIYNILALEATIAPNDMPYETRQKMFSYSAKLLDRTPDLAEKVSSITWAGFKIKK